MSANPYVVPREILDRYNTAGPRYTSYPTAPEWREDFTPAETYRVLDANRAERADVALSLYVHVPFCHKLCYYCGCNMLVTRDQDLVERYLAAVDREIAHVAERLDAGSREVVQIHWGGGTPTYLNPDQLKRLFGSLTSRFTLAKDAEISLEVHPPVTTFDQLETLVGLGFNRLSMGIQDFDPDVQKAVNRIQPFEQTRDLIARARALGFLSINTDLMYGLPLQTVEGFGRTLELVKELRPDRLALFNFAYLPWLKPHHKLIKESELPAPDTKVALLELAIAELLDQGYRYIGMDHFALPGDELAIAQQDRTLRRNFMGYTTCADSDLFSFGVTSISDLDSAYLANARQLPEYLKLVDERELPVTRGMVLSADDRLRRDVINRLICHCYLDKQEISRLHGIDFDQTFAGELEKLAPLEADGLLERHPDHLAVTARGQLLLRNICMVFDAYLGQDRQGGPKFSRTV